MKKKWWKKPPKNLQSHLLMLIIVIGPNFFSLKIIVSLKVSFRKLCPEVCLILWFTYLDYIKRSYCTLSSSRAWRLWLKIKRHETIQRFSPHDSNYMNFPNFYNFWGMLEYCWCSIQYIQLKVYFTCTSTCRQSKEDNSGES